MLYRANTRVRSWLSVATWNPEHGELRLNYITRTAAGTDLTTSASYAARGITDSLIENFDIVSGRAEVFHQSGPAINGLDAICGQLAEFLCLALPDAGINGRIGDSHIKFQHIVRDPA